MKSSSETGERKKYRTLTAEEADTLYELGCFQFEIKPNYDRAEWHFFQPDWQKPSEYADDGRRIEVADESE